VPIRAAIMTCTVPSVQMIDASGAGADRQSQVLLPRPYNAARHILSVPCVTLVQALPHLRTLLRGGFSCPCSDHFCPQNMG
jgi:hypothetical protein